jgi:hypothetical protein
MNYCRVDDEYSDNPLGIGSGINIYTWRAKPYEDRKLISEIVYELEDEYDIKLEKYKVRPRGMFRKKLKEKFKENNITMKGL